MTFATALTLIVAGIVIGAAAVLLLAVHVAKQHRNMKRRIDDMTRNEETNHDQDRSNR